jgi:hypothetical protein
MVALFLSVEVVVAGRVKKKFFERRGREGFAEGAEKKVRINTKKEDENYANTESDIFRVFSEIFASSAFKKCLL